jgi:uncharacterized membrane protein
LNFRNVKSVYTVCCIVLCLVLLAPALDIILPSPGSEKFSELWILGPGHKMEGYPYNIFPETDYHVFLGVSNQMGSLEYYLVRVKLANQSDSLPDKSAGIPSSLPTAYEYRLFVENNATLETDFSFSFNDISFEGNVGRISALTINGKAINVSKPVTRDASDNGFHYTIFFELWIYNSTISNFQFHDRSVGFRIVVNR